MKQTEACWVVSAESAEDALCQGLERLVAQGDREGSRAGPVLAAPCPVLIVTSNPLRRVVRAPWRDANPFFHLVEAAWMLAGRDDVASLTPYVKRFAEFAEGDGRVHGAYGHRWRHAFELDQLASVIQRLRAEPLTRQCVVSMWDPDATNSDDLAGSWRDRPCNTHIYLRQREVPAGDWTNRSGAAGQLSLRVLDLTVLCRSNDAVWGAHGANAVHFSFLHEYLASAVGSAVGALRQFSHNYHVYTSELERLQERAEFLTRTDQDLPEPAPMGAASSVDADLPRLWDALSSIHRGELFRSGTEVQLRSAFARTVLAAAVAHGAYKRGEPAMALHVVDNHMPMADWAVACGEWLRRRVAN